jgi:hypothetical protein
MKEAKLKKWHLYLGLIVLAFTVVSNLTGAGNNVIDWRKKKVQEKEEKIVTLIKAHNDSILKSYKSVMLSAVKGVLSDELEPIKKDLKNLTDKVELHQDVILRSFKKHNTPIDSVYKYMRKYNDLSLNQ